MVSEIGIEIRTIQKEREHLAAAVLSTIQYIADLGSRFVPPMELYETIQIDSSSFDIGTGDINMAIRS